MPRTKKPPPPTLLPRRADASERVARLFKIILLVHQRRPHENIGRAFLARECGCDAKTIGRDIVLLRNADVPFEYDAARRTYTLPEKAWSYPLAPLTPQDVMALALARDLVSAPGTPYAAAVRRALDNATAGLSVRLRNLLAEAGRVLLPGQLPRDYSHAPLGPLIEAAAGRAGVEIDYESRQSGRAWRRVDPYAVEARAGVYWELHGWCSDNNAVRTFALDRVRSVRPTGETFTVREAEWAAFVAQAGGIGGLRGGVDVPVAVRSPKSPRTPAPGAGLRH